MLTPVNIKVLHYKDTYCFDKPLNIEYEQTFIDIIYLLVF